MGDRSVEVVTAAPLGPIGWGVGLSIVTGIILVSLGYRKFQEWGVVARNIEGRTIVTAMGAAMVLTSVIVALLGQPFRFGADWPMLLFAHTVLLLAMALGGLLDDLFPEVRPVHGFTGHFGALFLKGRVTRGVVKAAIGGVAALWCGIVISHGVWAEGVVNGLIIALLASTINLLDVTPGRALKWWGLIMLVPLIVPDTQPYVVPLAMAAAIYAPLDLGRRAMMGDTGALALGASAGFVWCLLLSGSHWGLAVKLVLLTALVIVSVYAEMESLSRAIRRNPVLEYLDSLWVGPLRTRGGDQVR